MNFKITKNKGIHITFPNKVTVSIQFGPENYCDNIRYLGNRNRVEENNPKGYQSNTAEIAIWDGDNKWLIREFDPTANDDVIGYVTPDKVVEALVWAQKYK